MEKMLPGPADQPSNSSPGMGAGPAVRFRDQGLRGLGVRVYYSIYG